MSFWMTTTQGRDHYLSGPITLDDSNAPSIEEIAHALAQLNRFTGHARRPYSVAEHSLLVADIVRGMGLGCFAQMAALMHDAHEAFAGDVSSPAKWAIGTAWISFEAPQIALVRKTFGLKTAAASHRAAIKQADLIALATERRDLTAYTPGVNLPWAILDTPGAEVLPLEGVNLADITRTARAWTHWREEFLIRHAGLQAACHARQVELTRPGNPMGAAA